MQNLSLPDFIPNVTFLKGIPRPYSASRRKKTCAMHARLCAICCRTDRVRCTYRIYLLTSKNNFISFLFHLFLFLFFLSFILIFRKYIYNITVLKAIIFLFLKNVKQKFLAFLSLCIIISKKLKKTILPVLNHIISYAILTLIIKPYFKSIYSKKYFGGMPCTQLDK